MVPKNLIDNPLFVSDGLKSLIAVRGIIRNDKLSDKNKFFNILKVSSKFIKKFKINSFKFDEVYRYSMNKLEDIVDTKSVERDYRKILSKIQRTTNINKTGDFFKYFSFVCAFGMNFDDKVRRYIIEGISRLFKRINPKFDVSDILKLLEFTFHSLVLLISLKNIILATFSFGTIIPLSILWAFASVFAAFSLYDELFGEEEREERREEEERKTFI